MATASRTRAPTLDWPRLLGLLDEALELDDAGRSHWLRGLNLPPPLHQALLHLLAQRGQIERDDFLAALPSLALPDRRSAQAQGAAAPGSTVGPWRLLRRLGHGGMSVVWLAQRADGAVDRKVALKLPHAGPGQDLLARRMLRERRILAALEHPHIARLYDVGLSESGTPYLVMEFVSGQTLLAHADDCRLSVAARVALFQQVLAAVQHAHSRLVLHRDLKPANILVDGHGQAKLLDFGIAKLIAGEGGREDTDITRTAGRNLTPGYASPEQWLGQQLGPASDIYSLGVVLYELLCGTRPHEVDGASAVALERAVLDADPQPLDRRRPSVEAARLRDTQPAALQQVLRGDLTAVLLKALARQAEERYASAAEMSADLTRWQEGRPVAARAAGSLYLAAKFLRRHRLSAAVSGLALAVLLVAGGTAVMQGLAARQQAERATAARDFLLDLYTDAAPDDLRGGRPSATELLRIGELKARAGLIAQPHLQAEVLAGIGRAQYRANDMAGAARTLGQAADRFAALGDAVGEATARVLRLEVVVADRRFDDWRQRADELRPLLPTIERDRHLHLRWLLAAGNVEYNETRDVPPELWLKCIQLADPADPRQAAIAFETELVLVRLLGYRGQIEQAREHLAAAERLGKSGSPAVAAERAAATAFARSDMDMWANGFNAVSQWLPQRIADCDARLGPNTRRCFELKQRLLWAWLRLGDMPQAVALAPQLEPLQAQSAARFMRFSTAFQLVQVFAAAGLTEGAHQRSTQVLEEMLADTADPLPARHQFEAMVHLSLWYLRASDTAGAESWLARADALLAAVGPDKLNGAHHFLTTARALVLQARGEHSAALQLLGPSCKPADPGSASPRLGSLNCARSLVALGQRTQALALIEDTAMRMARILGEGTPTAQRARQLALALRSPRYAQPAWDGRQVFISGVR